MHDVGCLFVFKCKYFLDIIVSICYISTAVGVEEEAADPLDDTSREQMIDETLFSPEVRGPVNDVW